MINLRTATRPLAFCVAFLLLTTIPSFCTDTTYVRFSTSEGNIDVLLYSDEAPNNVANFLSYVDSGAYNNSIIHRSATTYSATLQEYVPFVIQGGGYDIVTNTITPITLDRNYTTNPVNGEPGISNTRGTIAMALSSGPNTATDQWFFNLGDNSAALDGTADGGPFTAFGIVANNSSLSTMDLLAQIPVPVNSDGSSPIPAFPQLPLINYVQANGVQFSNLVFVYSIARLTVQNFTTWQTAEFTSSQLANPAFISPTATPFNDGVTNLMKYVCDINPSAPMSAADRAKLPKFSIGTQGTNKYLLLTYQQYSHLVGVTVNVQTSADGKTWTNVSSPNLSQDGSDSTTGDPIIQANVFESSATQFIRLNVTMP